MQHQLICSVHFHCPGKHINAATRKGRSCMRWRVQQPAAELDELVGHVSIADNVERAGRGSGGHERHHVDRDVARTHAGSHKRDRVSSAGGAAATVFR
jgi:hypothetical protein